jgi:hypothetical protein
MLFYQVFNLYFDTVEYNKEREQFTNNYGKAPIDDAKVQNKGYATPHGSKVCHASCCPSMLSCSNGCVCMSEEDNAYFENRGANAVHFTGDF